MYTTYNKIFASLSRNDKEILWCEERIIKTNLTFIENCILCIEDKLKNSDSFSTFEECKSIVDSQSRLECYCGDIDIITTNKITMKNNSKDIKFSFQTVTSV